MNSWKMAAVQMDCRLGDRKHNLDRIRRHLREAAQAGARLGAFPECVLTGYGFDSKEEAWPLAEPLPGPTTAILARDCRELNAYAIFGLLESRPEDGALFNSCALVGPEGLVASYRKIHLPFLGVD